MKKLNVAVIGLAYFGKCFAEVYKAHPDVGELTLFDTDREQVNAMRERIGDFRAANSFEEILQDPSIDAVHLITPIPLHADQSVAVLEAGKHCACAVPMATSLEDIRRIIAARKRSGKNYMMMETTLYSYHFLLVSQLHQQGKLGKIQFLRGAHYQDMANWPAYWKGLPPMWYSTHAIAPLAAIAGSRICRVNCFGSGTMADDLVQQYGNPYPVESALLEFENGLKGEVTRSLFETARLGQEAFYVYGSDMSFEWGFGGCDDPYITTAIPPAAGQRGGKVDVRQDPLPNFYQTLPEPVRRFTVGENFDPANPLESLKTGAGGEHHGAHPHLVHEFLRSCLVERTPQIDEYMGANITAAGICAHESAMRNGEPVQIPDFRME